MASAAAVIGCTGLVGSHILSTALASPAFGAVHTISRRAPKSEGAKLHATIEANTSQWAAQFGALAPAPRVAFSALGTTRAQAGGLEAQWKIDHDLNVELARAAKAAGVATFVFISAAGISNAVAARLPYSKMKLGVEGAIRELEFDHAVVLRPGAILGPREASHQGMGQGLANGLVYGLRRCFGQGAADRIGQDAEVIARAAVHAARLAGEGKAPEKFWVLEPADIVRLGRTEWKE